MRSTSKGVGCQSYAQMGVLVLLTGASQLVLVVKNSPVNAGILLVSFLHELFVFFYMLLMLLLLLSHFSHV